MIVYCIVRVKGTVNCPQLTQLYLKMANSEDNSSVSSSIRQRRLTDKGHAYQVEISVNNYKSSKVAWQRAYDNIVASLGNISDVSILHALLTTLVTKYNDFLASFKRLESLEFDEKSDMCKEFNSCIEQQADMEKEMNDKISHLQDDGKDDESVHTSRRSHISRISRNSVNSKESQMSLSKRIDVARMVAKRRMELEYFEEEKKEELAYQKLLLKKSLAIAEAEQAAVDKIVGDEECVSHRSLGLAEIESGDKVKQYLESQPNLAHIISAGMIEHTQIGDQTASKDEIKGLGDNEQTYSLNPTAAAFQPNHNANIATCAPPIGTNNCQHSSSDDSLKKLVALLEQRRDRDSLARDEPQVFSGNLLEYPMWIMSFQSAVERKTSDPQERLRYLGKYTSGEAKETITSLMCLEGEEAYLQAKRKLRERFGNPFRIAQAYRKKIYQWPKIGPYDSEGLKKFADFLDNCKTAMQSTEYLKRSK